MAKASKQLLDVSTVGAFLRDRGVVKNRVTATALSGGVSNVVLGVSDGERSLVVKQSLERLRVPAEWHAPERRTIAEAAALRLFREIDHTAAPAVIDLDPEHMVLVVERAPEGAEEWKSALLRQFVDVAVARKLGKIVGRLHQRTSTMELPSVLEDDVEAFEALRLQPYHEAVAEALPALSVPVRAVADRIRATRECLVHGDLSPKNVLTLGQGDALWLIDFEVAQRGDPMFDLAFLLAHLLLKSIARPSTASEYDAAADAFLVAYGTERGPLETRWLFEQLGALLLARVVGKSRVEYLDDAQQRRAIELGRAALLGRDITLAELRRLRDHR